MSRSTSLHVSAHVHSYVSTREIRVCGYHGRTSLIPSRSDGGSLATPKRHCGECSWKYPRHSMEHSIEHMSRFVESREWARTACFHIRAQAYAYVCGTDVSARIGLKHWSAEPRPGTPVESTGPCSRNVSAPSLYTDLYCVCAHSFVHSYMYTSTHVHACT